MKPTQLRQVVYISNRPEVLAETLTYVKHFMPWITQAVVLTSDPEALKRAVDGLDLPDLVVLGDSEVTNEIPSKHLARNVHLRKALYARGPVDDVFLQSDDDYRPLKHVSEDVFLEDGRMVSYCFYDLALWRNHQTSFDGGQHSSYLALSYFGAPTLAYSSHMPQPMDRNVFAQAFADAERLSPSGAFCEWALPLNYGRHIAPERFAAPRTFRTMCWPEYPRQWPYWRRPEDVTFENFHAELYQPGHLFAGISTALDSRSPEQQAFSKLERWHAFDLAAGDTAFPKGVANPWETSAGRRAFFRAVRATRRFSQYVAADERAQLMGLAGRDNRLS